MTHSRIIGFMLASSVLIGGCVTTRTEKPYLTARAFDRAAHRCRVVSQGVHHARGSVIPFANYKLSGPSGETVSDQGQARACLTVALDHYRYDFLGEEIPKDGQ